MGETLRSAELLMSSGGSPARQAGTRGAGLVVDVRDHPHQVADVEVPCLLRNVARREVVMHEGRHVTEEALADHHAGVVVGEPVEHDARIASQALELEGGPVEHLVEARGAFECRRRFLELRQEVDATLRSGDLSSSIASQRPAAKMCTSNSPSP